MSIELKIKALSLAAEARVIRNQEKRIGRKLSKLHAKMANSPGDNTGTLKFSQHRNIDNLTSIHTHRVLQVREEARLTHLARAYLKGTPYKEVENKTLPAKTLSEDHFERISRMATSYGQTMARIWPTNIEDWVTPNTDGKTNWAEATS